MADSMLSFKRAIQLFSYDPETGVLMNRINRGVNGRSGEMSGSIFGKVGKQYLYVKVDYKRYLAHRLIWFLMTGAWPKDQIDHINGNRLDNRWINLRPATASQNSGNSKRRSDNSSGFKGVYWNKRDNKWQARIGADCKYLGLFDCPAAAYFAYVIAADKRFGEYARGN
jgi:hypothetical protein